ncbi:DNA-directed RNA polymerase subunit alpha [Flammeovirga pectinis]|uniref:DNA-directed RNA polymerase subunit alpha n=1 Tax=Flammeovirga pectinis TaxID=2494373 RepID=A0A3Q9FQC1_9BACT|nr:DNA-directed RNA polymerase subunit alpha [Flammeovirga pectinis]AZQ65494.1 DNA-directed RNA polymerase subunit alpha [Flammeovirga pectinis]
MSVLSFQKPDKVVMEKTDNSNKGLFEFKPLERGFGATIGNSFRRILLSSLEGYAVVGVKFPNVVQESSKINGVVEEVSEIILNLKQIRIKKAANIEEPSQKISIDFSGKTQLTAGDVAQFTDEYTILNPDLVICNLDGANSLSIELSVQAGRGYLPSKEQLVSDTTDAVGYTPIDAVFTPIKNVDYHVENTRVEQRTDYEKLVITIETDGSVDPQEALQGAANILIQHFAQITDKDITFEMQKRETPEELDPVEIKRRAILETSIADLELSVRAYNSLKAGEVKTLGDLVSLEIRDLMKFRNFGKKTLTELEELLSERDLTFGMDVSKYRLGQD